MAAAPEAGLPRLSLPPAAPPDAAPSAWAAAFEEASLLSPMGSSRSFSLPKSWAAGRQELLRLEAGAGPSSGWAAAAREART